uniref:Apple domain-containing protein n=1 Tax=Romanomermis culicivorax TaxID=13658 RepID=A0A915IZS0_ROMCU
MAQISLIISLLIFSTLFHFHYSIDLVAYENCNFVGNDIGLLKNIYSVDNCATLCKEQPLCTHFAWNPDASRCYLKRTKTLKAAFDSYEQVRRLNCGMYRLRF